MISYSKNREGAWVLSAFVGDELVSVTYYFYTKQEATKLFRQKLKEVEIV